MKKLFLVTLIAAVALASCGNKNASQQASANQAISQAEQPADATAAQSSNDNAGGTLTADVLTTGGSAAEEGTALATDVTAQADTAKPKGGSVKLTKAEFLKKVWNYETSPQEWVYLGDKPAIIDFYADWCAPCRQAAPILEEISNDFAGQVIVYKIDTQKEQELASVFGIQSIPAFLYIPVNGKPVMAAGIGRSKEDTKNMFVQNINEILLKGKTAGL